MPVTQHVIVHFWRRGRHLELEWHYCFGNSCYQLVTIQGVNALNSHCVSALVVAQSIVAECTLVQSSVQLIFNTCYFEQSIMSWMLGGGGGGGGGGL